MTSLCGARFGTVRPHCNYGCTASICQTPSHSAVLPYPVLRRSNVSCEFQAGSKMLLTLGALSSGTSPFSHKFLRVPLKALLFFALALPAISAQG